MDKQNIISNPVPNARKIKEYLEEFIGMVKKEKKEFIKFDDFLVEYRPEIILYLEDTFDRCDEGIDSLKRLFFERMKGSELEPNFYYTETTVQTLYRDFARRRGQI